VTHAAGRGVVLGNDYPLKNRNPWPYFVGQKDIWDDWNFAYRQCTSFVAWRLRSANGIPFDNQYLGLERWGNAGEWAASAKKVTQTVITVDTTPEVGAVAWSGPGFNGASADFGHVAWVAQVLNNGNIVIEEYNFGWSGAYNVRTVHPSAFQGYIHIKDMTKPFTKTVKPTISGAPMLGGTLTASVTAGFATVRSSLALPPPAIGRCATTWGRASRSR
jgi:surface antigen